MYLPYSRHGKPLSSYNLSHFITEKHPRNAAKIKEMATYEKNEKNVETAVHSVACLSIR